MQKFKQPLLKVDTKWRIRSLLCFFFWNHWDHSTCLTKWMGKDMVWCEIVQKFFVSKLWDHIFWPYWRRDKIRRHNHRRGSQGVRVGFQRRRCWKWPRRYLERHYFFVNLFVFFSVDLDLHCFFFFLNIYLLWCCLFFLFHWFQEFCHLLLDSFGICMIPDVIN